MPWTKSFWQFEFLEIPEVLLMRLNSQSPELEAKKQILFPTAWNMYHNVGL